MTTTPVPDDYVSSRSLAALLGELRTIYEPAGVGIWLFAPHKLLGGVSPISAIEDGKIEAVWTLVDQMQSGAFV